MKSALAWQFGLRIGPNQQSMRCWRCKSVNMSRRMAVCDAILLTWSRWRVHFELCGLVVQLEEFAKGLCYRRFSVSPPHDSLRKPSAKLVEFGGHAARLRRAIRPLEPAGPWAELRFPPHLNTLDCSSSLYPAKYSGTRVWCVREECLCARPL